MACVLYSEAVVINGQVEQIISYIGHTCDGQHSYTLSYMY